MAVNQCKEDGMHCQPWFCGGELDLDVCKQGIVLCIGETAISASDWLWAGYAFAAVLMVYYFCNENSAIHRSRKSETTYIIFVLIVVQGFHYTAFPPNLFDSSPMGGGENMTFENMTNDTNVTGYGEYLQVAGLQNAHQIWMVNILRRVIRLVLFLLLVLSHSSPEVDQNKAGDWRTAAALRHAASQPKKDLQLGDSVVGKGSRKLAGARQTTWYHCIRVQEEIEVILDGMVQRSRGGSLFFILRNGVMLFIYIALCAVDLAWVRVEYTDDFVNACFFVEIALLAYGCWFLMRSVVKVSKAGQIKKLKDLISILLSFKDKDMIEGVLKRISVPQLLSVTDWDTIILLTEKANEGGLLTVDSKGILIDALQKKGLRKSKVVRQVRGILLNTFGKELNILKTCIDEGGDYQNLYKLIYIDIVDLTVQGELVKHIKTEAKKMRLANGGAAIGVKILSDIDDTIYSSGGTFPAGCDRRFPKHVVYPGIFSLFRILDSSFDPTKPCCNLIFVSARPHVYKDYAEDKTYKNFYNFVMSGLLHSMPTVLAGQLAQGARAAATYACLGTRAWLGVGKVKLDSYNQFRELYFEYDYMFFGDNGQGDLWAGECMLEQQAARDQQSATTSAAPKLEDGSQPPGLRAPPSTLKQPIRDETSPLASSDSIAAVAPAATMQSASGTNLEQLESLELEPKLLAVIVHRVMDESKELTLTVDDTVEASDPASSDDVMRFSSGAAANPLHPEHNDFDELDDFDLEPLRHSSYVGAALDLHLHDSSIISLEDVIKVATDAVEEFDKLRFIWSDWGKRWEAAEEDMRLDLDRLQEVMQEVEAAGGVALPALPPLLRTMELLEKTELILPQDESPVPLPTSRTSRSAFSVTTASSIRSSRIRGSSSKLNSGRRSSAPVGGVSAPHPHGPAHFVPTVVGPIPENSRTSGKTDIELQVW